ncbi:MAG: hypothetical protein M1831_004175 [Alyxoria varia]|nr:MAG: hypothetical protein M1831_004175 [Alyxoria varia]
MGKNAERRKYDDFDLEEDIPDMGGKTILVTGGTSGIGAEAVVAMARHNPAHVYFTGRNNKAAEDLIQRADQSIQQSQSAASGDSQRTSTRKASDFVTFLRCDMTSLESVRDTCAELLKQLSANQRPPVLDILISNAGIMAVPPALTKDGYELQFGVNYLAHFLLTSLLLPAIRRSSYARIVNVSSKACGLHPGLMPGSGGPKREEGIVFESLKTEAAQLGLFATGVFSTWMRYGQSKLANVLHAEELARRYGEPEPDDSYEYQGDTQRVTAVSVHPGIITGTNLIPNLFIRFIVWITTIGRTVDVQDGTKNMVWAATAPTSHAAGESKDEAGGEIAATSLSGHKTKVTKNGGLYFPIGRVLDKPEDFEGLSCVTDEARRRELGERLWDWTETELRNRGWLN